MTEAERIQIAADIIVAEGARSGNPVPADVAIRAARQIYKIWYERVEPLQLEPGEVAQRLRERYEDTAWVKYSAVLSKRSDPYNFLIYVYGVTEASAREKLLAEYPANTHELVRFFKYEGDPLSDPNSFKGAKR